MNLKMTRIERNKIVLYVLILILVPLVFNKLGYQFTWNTQEIWSTKFLLLWTIVSIYLFASLFMISVVRNIFAKYLENPSSNWSGLIGKVGYYISSIVPALFILLVFTAAWIWHRDDFWNMLLLFSIWKASLIGIVLGCVAYLVERNRRWSLFYLKKDVVEVVKEVFIEKVIEVPVQTHDASGLPKKIALNEMYTYLLHISGVGPLFLDMCMIRFFDLVAIKTKSKVYHVIFSDGTMVRCDHIMNMLATLDLKHWMVKISDSYMINMLLVDFPYYKFGRSLLLHKESIEGLGRKMALADITLMLTMGAGITDRYIKEFWNRRNSLTHVGWDTWVPIRK